MILARLNATLLFMQGVLPAFLLGVLRPGGWFLACMTGLYALVTTGLWRGRRWGLPAALSLTLPQLVALSSPWLSWRFFMFASGGLGLTSGATILQMQIVSYRSFGGRLDVAFGYNQPLIADYASTGERSFVLFNVLALPLAALLTAQLVLKFMAAGPSPASVEAPLPTRTDTDFTTPNS